MKVFTLILFLALQGEAPVTTEVGPFKDKQECEQMASTWLRDKMDRRDVYIAKAYCLKAQST